MPTDHDARRNDVPLMPDFMIDVGIRYYARRAADLRRAQWRRNFVYAICCGIVLAEALAALIAGVDHPWFPPAFLRATAALIVFVLGILPRPDPRPAEGLLQLHRKLGVWLLTWEAKGAPLAVLRRLQELSELRFMFDDVQDHALAERCRAEARSERWGKSAGADEAA